jgi:ribonuclease Z
MSRYVLECFGVGDGWPCADRRHAAFLYRLGNVSLLMDAGEPIGDSLEAAGVRADTIDRIFLSHLHADHVGGLFMLLQGLWLHRRRKELAIHLPAGGVKPISQLLRAGYLFPELFRFRLHFKALRPARPVIVNGVRVTPHPSSHLEGMRRRFQRKYRQDFEAFCFLIEAGRRRIGHSADLGQPEDLEPLLRQPLDVLVCELAHFRPQDLFRHLRGRGIGRIIFVHLAGRYWTDLERTRRLAAKMLPGIALHFARDHEKFAL